MFLNFVALGPESESAAEAAEYAADQGKFFAYYDLLYEYQGRPNSGYLTDDRLAGFAAQLGLNGDHLKQALASGKYAGKVKESTEAGRSVGVRGTPTIFINGRPVHDPLDTAAIQAIILDELARSHK